MNDTTRNENTKCLTLNELKLYLLFQDLFDEFWEVFQKRPQTLAESNNAE